MNEQKNQEVHVQSGLTNENGSGLVSNGSGPLTSGSPTSRNEPSLPAADQQQFQSPGAKQEGPKDDGTGLPTLSKSQTKKLKRKQMWEDQKEDRKRIKKDKKHEKQARKRAEKEELIAEAKAAGLDPFEVLKNSKPPPKPPGQIVPISLIIDCDFEKFMSEKELVSLSTQLTRSYSDNRQGKYQSHLFYSSWQGFMKKRFETTLTDNHKRWKNAHFAEGDFVQAAQEAHDLMKSEKGGKVPDILKGDYQHQKTSRSDADSAPLPEPEAAENTAASVVYLTSDSPYTLEKLEPYTSYVIGGIVDKNREKGLCYKIAKSRGIRTAKLPIGEYMLMASRQVLTTNQVVDIMVKWLEHGDWGVAFKAAIPKRKGGVLRGASMSEEQDDENGGRVLDDGEGHDDESNAKETAETSEAAVEEAV